MVFFFNYAIDNSARELQSLSLRYLHYQSCGISFPICNADFTDLRNICFEPFFINSYLSIYPSLWLLYHPVRIILYFKTVLHYCSQLPKSWSIKSTIAFILHFSHRINPALSSQYLDCKLEYLTIRLRARVFY